MDERNYETMLRERITELRLRKNVSEHRMSLDLDKSGSYIRGITSGTALPSAKGLFRIIQYFDMSPAEFFSNMESGGASLRSEVGEKLHGLSDEELERVNQFIEWIKK